MRTCPNCGHALTHFADAPTDWAPWQCPSCDRGWWDAELTGAARKLWLGETGWDLSKTDEIARLRDHVDRERATVKAVRLLASQGRSV